MILKSINYWSYPGGLDGSLPLDEFIGVAKAQGFDAVEVCIGAAGALTPNATKADCERILDLAKGDHMKVASVASGLYWDHALGDSDPASRKQAKEELEAMIQITHWLGCKTLLTIPGAVEVFFLPDRPVQPYRQVEENARAGLKAVAPLAEKLGVRLGIENVWNKFLMSPYEMATFIDTIGSPAIGAYVDVGNVLPFGYAQDWILYLDKRVFGVHFKDYRKSVGGADGFVDLLEGDVDWPAIMLALAEIGYEGPVVAEMIPGYTHHPMVRCRNTSTAMDAILGR